MSRNMGTLDRALRIVVALVLAFLAWNGIAAGTLGMVAYVVAVVLLATSLIGWCPAYLPFGINTCRTR